jgi:hypothetical protein
MELGEFIEFVVCRLEASHPDHQHSINPSGGILYHLLSEMPSR